MGIHPGKTAWLEKDNEMTGNSKKKDGIIGSLFRKKRREHSDSQKKAEEKIPSRVKTGEETDDLDRLMRKLGVSPSDIDKIPDQESYKGTVPPLTDQRMEEFSVPKEKEITAGLPQKVGKEERKPVPGAEKGREVPEQQAEMNVPGRGKPASSAMGMEPSPHSGGESGDVKEEMPSRVFPSPTFSPAKKAVSSPKGETEKDGVVSVDDIDDLSGLILPKGATFKVDEIKLPERSEIFKFKGLGGDSAGKELQKSDLIDTSIRKVTEVASEVQAEAGASAFLKKLNVLSVIHKVPVEYNPRTHGPLVDLTFRPRPGVEQIELYPVNEPYAYVRITYDNATHEYLYEVLEPKLTPAENDLFRDIKERIFERLDINTQNVMEDIAKKTLRDVTDDIIRDYGITLTPVQREKILYAMYKEFLGNGMIDPLMHDRYIEDISCDGVNANLFVFHNRYESMRTNLMYRSAEELDSFVIKLAQRSGKYISIAEPMLDATMSDGSRIQMTLGSEVTAHGSTYTIRKFKDEPITPTDLIEWRTFSPLAIAFFWLAVESGKSCIFAGGTASGKTTSLNAISLFIPPLAKIVTLEDTRELKLPHPNWIPSITRTSFDASGKGEIDMYELLRAALRQRPEYILVGEVRGKEALTLFQAMSTGHVTYSTMHADSVASIVHRLENPPLNVPRNMLSALDLISVQVQARVGGQRIRRNKQIIEILDIDPRTNELITNEVFRWHPATDEITYSGKSYVLEEIMESRGWDEERMKEELKMRQEVLEWMRLKKIRHFRDVSNILIQYFRDPVRTMERIRAELYGET